MINLFSHLFKPYGYLFIKGINGKRSYDWYAPIILTIFSCFFFYGLGISPNELLKEIGRAHV